MANKKSKKSVRSRAKYRCPERLAKVIELVNSIPPDRKLPHLRMIFDLIDDDDDGLNHLERYDRAEQMANDLLVGVPESFIGNRGFILNTYEQFRGIRATVHAIAQLASLEPQDREHHRVTMLREEKHRKAGPMPDAWREELSKEDLGEFGHWHWPAVNLIINPAGIIEPRDNDWILALVGIEASRLRECQICQRIFWAQRDEAKACGGNCAGTLRQRRLREKQHEYERNRARRES